MDLPVPSKINRPPRTRWDQIPRMLREQGVGALVATSPENVTYTSGHYEYTRPIIPDRITATIIPSNGTPTYLVVHVIEGAAKQHSWIKEIATYRENAESPIRLMASVLSEKGLDTGVVAIEKEHLSAAYFGELQEQLPKVQFRDGSSILARARSIKTEEEVAFIETVERATETAHLRVYQTLKPGDTEISIARRVHIQNLLEGADFTLHSIAEAGRNGLEGHHIADDTPIRLGDVVNIDSGARFAGYATDISRPVVVGKPTQRQRTMWQKLRDAQRRGVDSMRVGVRAGEAFEGLRRQREYGDITFYGHGVGVFSHDAPMLLPHHADGLRTTTNLSADWELEPNMLLMVEFSLIDKEAAQPYHFEDLVLVTDGGPRILTDVIDTAELYVIE